MSVSECDFQTIHFNLFFFRQFITKKPIPVALHDQRRRDGFELVDHIGNANVAGVKDLVGLLFLDSSEKGGVKYLGAVTNVGVCEDDDFFGSWTCRQLYQIEHGG